ncbi:MAG: hypothetical protein D6824_07880 [Planctomycetota bacterium]|nr:MAG: hypothetical protein D6824_07880 [Planctomycetota bacterium]
MKCDRCDNPATVHEVRIEKGKRVEKHLCEACAQKEGLSPAVQTPVPLAKFLIAHAPQLAAKQAKQQQEQVCPRCALRWSEFRQHGLLGCPTCYDAFAELLLPLIERAQEGAVEHVGKTPARAGADIARQQRVRQLRRELAEALKAEEYERAAELRDAIQALVSTNGHSAASGDDDEGKRRVAHTEEAGAGPSASAADRSDASTSSDESEESCT